MEVVRPEELYDIVWHNVAAKIGQVQYERVMMSLPEVLSGDFFNEYVKKGKVTWMLALHVLQCCISTS